MKKIFFYITVLSLPFMNSCKNDSTDSEVEQVSIETQNTYDDQAIQKFLNGNYFDTQGNITEFSTTDATDDNYPKLADLNPITLPSGVVYIVRSGAQPSPGKVLGSSDILRMMHKTVSYIAKNSGTSVTFASQYPIINTMASTGVPDIDPPLYYAKASLRSADKPRDYFEIEGFREALQYFKSYEIDDSAAYNLQGVIIVPSRAAYARNANYFDVTTGYKFNDRSFVFNFQIYKTSDRPASEL